MNVYQKEITLRPYPRGMHVITETIQEAVRDCQITSGIVHVFILHTSAGLTINENADPTVRVDFNEFMNRLVKEQTPYFTHTYEGPDDMPSHIKSSFVGSSISFPITNGRFQLGTWQGVYLCEFRNHGGNRKLVVTISGS